MTPAEMSEAKDLLARATQRPWAVLECHASRIFAFELVRNNKSICSIYRAPTTSEYDKNLIVRAPELLEKALEYIAALEAETEGRRDIDTICAQPDKPSEQLPVRPRNTGETFHPAGVESPAGWQPN